MTPIEMIHNMHLAIKDGHGWSDEEAFDALLEWVAVQISVDPGLPTRFMKEEVVNQLHATFNLEALRADMQDWFGEYHEQMLGKTLYVDPVQAQREAELMPVLDPFAMPMPVLFGDCGSGRKMMEYFRRQRDAIVYYGITDDIMAYHIALVNSKIYGIPSFILCADHNVVVSSVSSKNWFYANLWSRPEIGKLEQN